MKYLILPIFMILTGCDTFYGLRVTTEPSFNGNWACLTNNIDSIGLIAAEEPHNSSMLFISSTNNKFLFSVMPDYGGAMSLSFKQAHGAPRCEDSETSIGAMKKFIALMAEKCNYKVESYKADMQCNSYKISNPATEPQLIIENNLHP